MLLRILRRRLWVVIACVVLIPGAALGYSLSQHKRYSANASLLFRDPALDQKLFGSTVFQPTTDPAREAETNLQLVGLEVVAARTSAALGGKPSQAAIQSAVTVAPAGQSNVARITASDASPAFAAKLANTFAEQFIAFRQDADRSKIVASERLVARKLAELPHAQRTATEAAALRTRADQLSILASLQTGNAELVQPAIVPQSPSSPKPVRNVLIALALALIVGFGAAVLLERLDRRLRDPREIGDTFGRPVLGAIPESRNLARTGDALATATAGEAEAFRMLRASLRYFNVDREVRSVLVTSAAPGEGKSTIALYLAAAAANAGDRALLIEADLRRPTLAKSLGLSERAGLSQLLAGQVDLSGVVQSLRSASAPPDAPDLHVVVCGPLPPNPSDLIESSRMREVIRAAEQRYDLVVIDTPPTSVVSDAIPLVKEVSGVIVVTRLGKTTRDSAGHLRSQLTNLGAYVIGVVVNGISRASGAYYGYGSYSYTAPKAQPTANGVPPQDVQRQPANGMPPASGPAANHVPVGGTPRSTPPANPAPVEWPETGGQPSSDRVHVEQSETRGHPVTNDGPVEPSSRPRGKPTNGQAPGGQGRFTRRSLRARLRGRS